MKQLAGVVLGLGLATCVEAKEPPAFAGIVEQQQAMSDGKATAEGLTKAYLKRIETLDRRGPKLHSIIAINPKAVADARRLDAERRAGKVRGPLHGVTILIKDNIDSADGLATTAGSLALAGNVTGRDAPLVARLRAGGAVILGKTNLSEWANYRSSRSISGWSAVGGLTRNPHVLDRTACGSSSGSGAATAAALAAGAIGTETDGSITCPAAMNGIVGLKPTVGLVSRTFIVPIAASQDTAGPMTRNVADAAAILSVIAGADPADPATAQADAHRTDYVASLSTDALKGARLAVLRPQADATHPAVVAFDKALAALKAQGAVLVEVKQPLVPVVSAAEEKVLATEFKAGVAAYLATTKAKPRTLADLIAFNAAEPRETPLFGQETFERAQASAGLDDPAYRKAKAEGRQAAAAALDGLLEQAQAVAVIALSGGPAATVDPLNGSRWFGSPSSLPAVSGYPHLTVPMDAVFGLPIGLSFIGPAWSEARLLSLGYAFEQATHARRTPAFLPSIAADPAVAAAYDRAP